MKLFRCEDIDKDIEKIKPESSLWAPRVWGNKFEVNSRSHLFIWPLKIYMYCYQIARLKNTNYTTEPELPLNFCDERRG